MNTLIRALIVAVVLSAGTVNVSAGDDEAPKPFNPYNP